MLSGNRKSWAQVGHGSEATPRVSALRDCRLLGTARRLWGFPQRTRGFSPLEAVMIGQLYRQKAETNCSLSAFSFSPKNALAHLGGDGGNCVRRRDLRSPSGGLRTARHEHRKRRDGRPLSRGELAREVPPISLVRKSLGSLLGRLTNYRVEPDLRVTQSNRNRNALVAARLWLRFERSAQLDTERELAERAVHRKTSHGEQVEEWLISFENIGTAWIGVSCELLALGCGDWMVGSAGSGS
jgi:hypothetical protein